MIPHPHQKKNRKMKHFQLLKNVHKYIMLDTWQRNVWNNLINCEKCQNYLVKSNTTLDNKDQLLILNKTFEHIELNSDSGLKAPSENLEKFVIICLNVFKQNYCHLKSEKYLVNQLMTKANQSIPKNIVPLECAKHFEYIMKLLFVVNVYKTCN